MSSFTTLLIIGGKNGILIVEFANQLQIKEGLSKQEAIEQASAIRLRPILMTAVAMIVAMLPLLMASGPGASQPFRHRPGYRRWLRLWVRYLPYSSCLLFICFWRRNIPCFMSPPGNSFKSKKN
ncbi:efflux RND transporter permease subunit [Methyloglobulus sp.]|uniref:efflux RND transporter permease subunit n=1 Tax=Methyloglobulus sp. TaxID=2518622 RepID=UPI0032B734F9